METGTEMEAPQTFLLKLRADMLAIKDSVLTDRHSKSGQNNDDYNDNYPQNLISGILPSFSLNGWLRHGMERVLINDGVEACHPSNPDANLKRKEVYERDLGDGYHEKGSCLKEHDQECLVFELYGGFQSKPGKFMRKPIRFSPVRSNVDQKNGEAEAHYRRINQNLTSRNREDKRVPFRNAEKDVLANLDGSWKLKFRELRPEYVYFLKKTVDFLQENNEDFMHQLGGARNFGGGIVDVELLNPFYSEKEVGRIFDRGIDSKTNNMEDKDQEWQQKLEEHKQAYEERIEQDKELFGV